MAAPRIGRLRWWMIGLLMLGSIVNYLTRSTLAVAAPTLMKELSVTAQEYSWIVGTFQATIMLQPVCGYVLDVVGLKLGFAMFATAWSLINMAHGLAHNWQGFAVLRGLLGFAEGCANPAGMKATAEWFPAKERGLAGGLFNIGASAGSMLAPPLVAWAILAYNWQSAFVITGIMGIDFQWLRTPWPDELFSLVERPGFLRLFGRETIGSVFRQSLVARRQQSHCFGAATVVEFEPEHFQQMAGLICYYNSAKFHYLYVSRDETAGKHLRVMSCVPDSLQTDAFTPPVAIPAGKPMHLRVEVDYEPLQFAYRLDGVDNDWRWLPQQFDASILSDEATAPGLPNFTGAFVGIACQDLAGTLRPADFDFFEYRDRSYRAIPSSAS